MRHVTLTLLAAAALGLAAPLALAADQPKEGKMANLAAPPQRLILDGIPQIRYIQDGFCPFALCLKSAMDYLGTPCTYRSILATSGACFRMTWNFTQWDPGNMDIRYLGAEPFRQTFRALGYQPSFVLRKDALPADGGQDLAFVEDGQAAAVFRWEIVQSLRAGKPVLAFGVVGPPEVSLVTGYDEGGDVLLGWTCFPDEHPKDQFERNGAFRQRNWAAKTHGLILIERKLDRPTPEAVALAALEWAYRVATLAKSKTHCFGQAAHRGWADGMLKDIDFPEDDEKVLGARRATLYDGLIMLHERGEAAGFLEDAARLRPDAAEHLLQAARLFREEAACGAAIMSKPLGHHTLPTAQLADPCARRDAAELILAAGEKNTVATRQLAFALGKKPPGFAFDGKELKGLRPKRRWMTRLGALAGCLRFLGKDIDDAWLYGVTGAAFMLNIDGPADVSGPTSWDDAHLVAMAPRLGVTLSRRVRALTADADFGAKQQAAALALVAKIDAGLPCYGWDGGFPEYITINGYDREGLVYWTHYTEAAYKRIPWDKFGRNDTECFEVTSVEPVAVQGDDRETIREALRYALTLRDAKPTPQNAQGLAAYGRCIAALETGDWRKLPLSGCHHNAACWHECRAYAERFLRLAGDKLGGDLKPQFDQAAGHYRAVRKALCALQGIFIYRYPLPPVDDAGVKLAIELLRTAKQEETKGLSLIEGIVGKL